MNEKEYYKVPYISNSALSWFKISPLYCHKKIQNEIEDEEKRYLTLGKQIHMAILEPELFSDTYTVLDTEIPRSESQKKFCDDYLSQLGSGVSEEEASILAYKKNYSTTNKSDNAIAKDIERLLKSLKEYISYLKAKQEYVEVLSKNKSNLIQSIISTVKSHKKAKLLFDDPNDVIGIPDVQAFNETPIYWEYPIVVKGEKIKCKSLIDRIIIDHKEKKITLIDFKTSSKLGKFKEEFELFEYYRQLSFYWMAINSSFTNISKYTKETLIVACSTVEPYECKVFRVNEEDLERGTKEIEELMNKLSWHYFSGKWDYTKEYHKGDGVETL